MRDFTPYRHWLIAICAFIVAVVVAFPATLLMAQISEVYATETYVRRVSGPLAVGIVPSVITHGEAAYPVQIAGFDAGGALIVPTFTAGGNSNVNIAQVGGAAFAQGARAVANSLSMTQDTTGDWTVRAFSGSAAGAATRLTLGDMDSGAGVADRLQVQLITPGAGGPVSLGDVIARPFMVDPALGSAGAGAPLQLADMDTGAGVVDRLRVGLIHSAAGGPAELSYGIGNSGADTLQITEGGRASTACGTSDLGIGADTQIFAARAGRKSIYIQNEDVDGAARCATGAVSTNGIVMNPALAANQAGGSWAMQNWAGAVNCRSLVGTVTINYCETY